MDLQVLLCIILTGQRHMWTRKSTRYAWGRGKEQELRKLIHPIIPANCRSSRSGGLFDVWAAGKYLWLFQIKRGNRPTNGFIQRWLLAAHKTVMVPHSYIFLAWYNPRKGWHFFRLSKVHRVYKITNQLDGMSYIGVTSRYMIWDRWTTHCTNLQDSLIGAAIIRDGVHNFNFEVLEVCGTLQELSNAERKWIAHYNTMNPNGYNRTPGGLDGLRGISHVSRMRAGRKRRGELHPMAKLSNRQIAEIKKSKLDAWGVAEKYKISYGHARALVLGYRRVLAN